MKVWLVKFYTHYTKGYSPSTDPTAICSIGETENDAIENAQTLYATTNPGYSFRSPIKAIEITEVLGYKITAEKI